jgi:hypothetical protein
METKTEHPILFSGAMVRAIMTGHKTMTRRVVKTNSHTGLPFGDFTGFKDSLGFPASEGFLWAGFGNPESPCYVKCPYGRVGDRLWVRETWNVLAGYDGGGMRPYQKIPNMKTCHTVLIYAADVDKRKMRPSIHMPRWASRITLEIVSIRVERLQVIDELGALDEGVECERIIKGVLNGVPGEFAEGEAREGFIKLWDSINAKRGFGWKVNPWVWVIEFKRI